MSDPTPPDGSASPPDSWDTPPPFESSESQAGWASPGPPPPPAATAPVAAPPPIAVAGIPSATPTQPPAPGWWLASDGNWYAPPNPYAQQLPAGYGAPYGASQTNNGLAIASMVLGIVWIYWIGSILAVIFGHIALGQIKRTGQSGRGMAIAGLVLGYVGIGILILVIIIAASSESASVTFE